MMCKAILNYGCVPSITNQSSRYVGLVTVCYKCLQQNESSVQFSRKRQFYDELIWLKWVECRPQLWWEQKLRLLYLFKLWYKGDNVGYDIYFLSTTTINYQSPQDFIQYGLHIFYLPIKWIRHKLKKLMKSSPNYNLLF